MTGSSDGVTKIEVISEIEVMPGLHVGELARPDQRESFPGWWVGKKRNRGLWLKHCHAFGPEQHARRARNHVAGAKNAGKAQGAITGRVGECIGARPNYLVRTLLS